ncbi:hypothetical protein TNCV_2212141 [Trichonephila clavipes]|nr:hypothetical protein TNCV_2212141 [Trichonephila clavipes]
MFFLHRGGSQTRYLSIRPGEGALLPSFCHSLQDEEEIDEIQCPSTSLPEVKCAVNYIKKIGLIQNSRKYIQSKQKVVCIRNVLFAVPEKTFISLDG